MTQLGWPDIFTSGSELNFGGLLAQWPATAFGAPVLLAQATSVEALALIRSEVSIHIPTGAI